MLIEPTRKAPDIFISRQAIYDANEDTFAYELLFHNNEEEYLDDSITDQVTSEAVLNVFMEVGLKHLVADKQALINLANSYLTEKHTIPFPKDKFILQIDISHGINEEFVDAISDLQSQGFRIALDNFEDGELVKPLVKCCDLIKIDFRESIKYNLSEVLGRLKPLNKNIIVKNVHTREDFEFCKAAGFDYVQGSFLCQPKVVKYKTLPSNKLLLMQIIAKTQDPKVEFDELEDLITQDVGISYKLLRLINSANFGLTRKVESLHQALLLLGMKEIKSWAALVALSNIDSVPQEVTDMSMTRARMCKLLAEKTQNENADSYFTLGMFSLLDVLMGRPLLKLLGSMPFSEELNLALLEHKGDMGEALDCAIANEQGDWAQIKYRDLSSLEINEIYISALEWSRSVRKQLASPTD